MSGRGENNNGRQAGNSNQGSGSTTKENDMDTAGMLAMSALMGAQMAAASSQSSPQPHQLQVGTLNYNSA